MKADSIIGAVEAVTKKWAKQRKAEERDRSAHANRASVMVRRRRVTIKDAAFEIMEEAYLKASANGRLPAHARQIMYATRGHVQRTADKGLGTEFDKYFSKQLLPDYMELYGVSESWNVVFDARGHFHEPHTKKEVPLGTIAVREYLDGVSSHRVCPSDFGIIEKRYPTFGPRHRFGAILFIEKEGFMPLFEAVKLAERYDIAIMSTKGMSVTASRELVEKLCSEHDIPLFVLHDFDKAGFSVAGTLKRSTRRYQFRNNIQVIDFGLRLEDIVGLETEEVYIPRRSHYKARQNMALNGATEEEIEFLLHRRVELNAFASDELIAWIEAKLDEHGVTKVIPDSEYLTDAYRRALVQQRVQERINTMLEDDAEDDDEAVVPSDLAEVIARQLKNNPAISWDAVVKQFARDQVADED
jgi:hypothetical protein